METLTLVIFAFLTFASCAWKLSYEQMTVSPDGKYIARAYADAPPAPSSDYMPSVEIYSNDSFPTWSHTTETVFACALSQKTTASWVNDHTLLVKVTGCDQDLMKENLRRELSKYRDIVITYEFE